MHDTKTSTLDRGAPVPSELAARVLLVEEGASASAISSEDHAATTVAVPLSEGAPWNSAHRIERRFTELAQAGLNVTEVVLVLAARAGATPCTRRLAALHAVCRCTRRTDALVVLELPPGCPAVLRDEIFTLAEFLMAERELNARIRIRFAPQPARSHSGFFASPLTASPLDVPARKTA